ncbi:protein of unknown function [Pseudodesulfovibrio profundus]|uniref:Uncharacterized protein n=1 Tax=Pseudodesulfovibrio profundus TaxID=57320 RepID=A0A2C8F612_9BACT|nr:protein of unknown function [Pseudodesulfovibrio profundus]
MGLSRLQSPYGLLPPGKAHTMALAPNSLYNSNPKGNN